MIPRVGQPAPLFRARSDDGRLIDLTQLRGRWVVLYFYPRASTPGCSVEAQRFEAALPEFERLNAAVMELQGKGVRVMPVQGNIADQHSAESLIDRAVQEHGQLDVLVNNAGVMDYMAGVGEVTDDVWQRVLGINLNGPMFTMRRAVQQMLTQETGGSIVNVGSTASLSGGAAGAAYTASKHGILGLTRSTAWQYAKRGIRCNLIAPGGTATNIAESMPQDKIEMTGAQRAGAFSQLIPNFLQPSDIANLALYLASDESKLINGAVISADGGWMAL